MKRKHKNYSRPKKLYSKERILEETRIEKEFGLKNKKEIWKADTKVSLIRARAKKLIPKDESEKQSFIERQKKKGFNINSIADILALNKEDYLKRRLQTIVLTKGISTTARGARQLIVHKKIMVDNNIIDKPSYLVPVHMENKISLKKEKLNSDNS